MCAFCLYSKTTASHEICVYHWTVDTWTVQIIIKFNALKIVKPSLLLLLYDYSQIHNEHF